MKLSSPKYWRYPFLAVLLLWPVLHVAQVADVHAQIEVVADTTARTTGHPDSATTLLKAWIAQEFPRMTEQGLTDWERVGMLRAFTHRNMDWASPGALLEADRTFHIQKATAPELFSLFRTNRGGVKCGGAAVTLRKLYELYGYQAVTLDTGFPGTRATHVVVVVKLENGDNTILSVQDPTFNRSYTLDDNRPADVIEMMDAFLNGEQPVVQPTKEDVAVIDVIVAPHDAQDTRVMRELGLDSTDTSRLLPDGRLLFRQARPPRLFLDMHASRVLIEHGLPPRLEQLLTRPLHISGSADPAFDVLAQRIKPGAAKLDDIPDAATTVIIRPVTRLLTADDAAFIASNARWRDTAIICSGRAENRYTYVVSFLPMTLVKPREVIFEGDLTSGGITVGVTKDNQWHTRVDITTPRAFRSSLTIKEPGIYTLIVANNITTGPVVNEFVLRVIGWSDEFDVEASPNNADPKQPPFTSSP